MIFEAEPGHTEAPFTTALDVFRIALVIFAREVANRDPQLAKTAFAEAEAAVQARLGTGVAGSTDVDLVGRDAAIRNAVSHQLRKVLVAAKTAIEEQAADGAHDAGG